MKSSGAVIMNFEHMCCFALFVTIYATKKNVKNTHGEVILLVALQTKACNITKSNTPPWVFSRFLNYTNGTKSCKAAHSQYIEE